MSGNDSNNPSAPPMRWRGPALGFSALLILASVWGIAGCGGSDPDPTPNPNPDSRPDDALLRTAIDMMQPDRLGIDAQPRQAAGLLNQWRAVKLKTTEKERLSQPLSDETRRLLNEYLSAETMKQISQDNFAIEDVEHIRGSFLAKEISQRVTKGVEGQLNRAQVLFDYVTRNVQLVDPDNALPLMPYEILALGEGTAEDRAWVFAELLRQLNLDSVIVKPQSSESSASPAIWFVGVVAEDEIRLFDPLRATPVPLGPRGDHTDILPATPAELTNPIVLESLIGSSDDPLAPALFDNLQIELIGTPTLWAPRMASLEKRLTGKDAAVIYQELTGEPDDLSAILNRLGKLKATGWSLKDVRPWKHPESRFQEREDSDELNQRWKPFLVPYAIVPDLKNQELTVGNPSYEMLRIRTMQLRGEYKDAIRGYLRVQLRQQNVPPQVSADIRTAYSDAAEDAFFWSGVCQMEQDTPQAAVDKLAEYVRRTEKFSGSRHAEHARVLMALCLEQLGRPAEAVEVLKPLKPTSPEYAAAEFLKRELAEMPGPSSPEKPNNPKPKPKTATKQEPDSKEPDAQSPRPAIAEKPMP